MRLLGNGQATTTSPSGTFTLPNIEVTSGLLLFRADVDGELRQRVVQLSEYGTGPSKQVNLGDIVMGANATVRGHVFLADKLPARGGHGGTTLFVPAGPFTAFTNDDGSFVIEQMPEGPVELYAFRTGYAPQSLGGVTLRSGEVLTLQDLSLEISTDTTPGSLSGTLAFDPAVTGQGDARVRLVSSEGQTVDAMIAGDDTFKAASVPVGLYRLIATRSGYSQLEVINVLIVSGVEAKVGTLTLTTAPAFDAGPPPTYDGSVPFDAGIDAGTDAGLDAGIPLCSGPADCTVGQWCDPRYGRCVPVCFNDTECGFGRVCDTATGTCENSCSGTCPAGQTCSSSNVCVAVCSGAFPCPSGKRCAAGVCINECDPLVANSCNSPFLSCDLGACKRNTFCTGDLDCASTQLCVNNQCGARPTDAGVLSDGGTSADGGLFFACSIPCQCRVGEQCADGFCQPDIIPTYFVALDGGGNGLSASSPSSVLYVGDSGVLPLRASLDGGPGVVALRREDAWDFQQRTLRVSNGTELAGGFTDCQDGRWIRDRSHRTTITGEGGDTSNPPTGLLLFDANAGAVTKGVVSGLALTLTGTRTCGGAIITDRGTVSARSDGLWFHDLDGTINLGTCMSPTLMFRTIGMRNGLLQRIKVLGLSASSGLQGGGFSFNSSSFTLEDIDIAPANLTTLAIAIDVGAAPEASVFRRVHIGRFTSGDDTARAIWVRGLTNGPITMEDVTIDWGAARSPTANFFSGISIERSGLIDLKRVLIDGTGHPGPVPNYSRGIELTGNTAGTLRDVEVRIPTNLTGVNEIDGLYVTGNVGYDIQNLTVTGQGLNPAGSNTANAVRFTAVNSGMATTIRNSNFSIQGRRPIGVNVVGSGNTVDLSVVDSRIDVRGDGTCLTDARGVFLDGSGTPAKLRVERTQLSVSNSALVLGGYLVSNAELDLFASTIKMGSSYGSGACTGAMSQYGSIGVALSGSTPRLVSRANTIDSGGVQGQQGQSTAIYCDSTSATVAALESSVLTAGNGTPSRFIGVTPSTPNPLCNPSTAASNYFWRYPTASTVPAPQEGLFDGGMLSVGANTSGTTSCFAASTPLADGGFTNPYVPSGAPCLNGGFITQHIDGTPVLFDVFGRGRDGGNGQPDIGAIEAP